MDIYKKLGFVIVLFFSMISVYSITEINPNTFDTSDGGITSKLGVQIIVNNQNLILNSVNKTTTGTPTYVYIFDNINNQIANASFIGNKAIFSSPVTLNAGERYNITTDANGGTYVRNYDSAATHPQINTYFNWTAGINGLNSFTTVSYMIYDLNFELDSTPAIETNLSNVYAIGNFSLSLDSADGSEVNMSIILDGGSEISVSNNTNSSSYTFTNIPPGNHNISFKSVLHGVIYWNNETFEVSPEQYFRFYDPVRSLYVNSFTFGGYSSAGEYAIINATDLSGGLNTLQFSKFGYSRQNFTFTINNTAQLNLTYNVTPVTITVQAFSEVSPTTQLTFNLSMNNVSDYTQYLNQVNFSKYYNETLTGNLTLTIESDGYCLRKVFTELNPYTTVSHVVYLTPDTDCDPVIFRTLNLAQTLAIEDVVLTFKKEIAGIPTFVGQATTDSQGYTYFNMDVLVDYEITISKDGYIQQIINSIPGKLEYNILMEEDNSINSYLFDNFAYYISPTGTAPSLPFQALAYTFDQSNLLSSMRFTVTGDNVSYTDVLTDSSGGTLNFTVTNASALYTLNLSVIREGVKYDFIEVLNYYDAPATNVTVQKVSEELNGVENNEDRIFIMLIFYVVAIAFGAFFGATVAAVVGLIPLTIYTFVGWLPIGITAILYVFTILGVLFFER